MTAKIHQPAQHQKKEPHVGIFWIVDGKLLIDSLSLSQGEDYGDFKTHPRSHFEVWDKWQLNGKVSSEFEYEEFPRGRVMFDTTTRRFMFLADRCILNNKGIVDLIMSSMNLPENTETDTDDHYRCFACLRSRAE